MLTDCENKQDLQDKLTEKSIQELEYLLIQDFETNETANAEYIQMIMEVIEKKEREQEIPSAYTDADVEDARLRCKEYRATQRSGRYTANLQVENDAPHNNHLHKNHSQAKARPFFRFLRYGIAAALTLSLIGGYAFGWDVIQIIADWTVETFSFEKDMATIAMPKTDVFDVLKVAVEDYTDIPMIPTRAPKGTQPKGNIRISMRDDRVIFSFALTSDGRDLSMQIIVHTNQSEFDAYHTYQKDDNLIEEYLSNDIVYYITGNASTKSAMWVNGNVEGLIQGDLTIEELREMIDSI